MVPEFEFAIEFKKITLNPVKFPLVKKSDRLISLCPG
jgi:hypothetical protein